MVKQGKGHGGGKGDSGKGDSYSSPGKGFGPPAPTITEFLPPALRDDPEGFDSDFPTLGNLERISRTI